MTPSPDAGLSLSTDRTTPSPDPMKSPSTSPFASDESANQNQNSTEATQATDTPATDTNTDQKKKGGSTNDSGVQFSKGSIVIVYLEDEKYDYCEVERIDKSTSKAHILYLYEDEEYLKPLRAGKYNKVSKGMVHFNSIIMTIPSKQLSPAIKESISVEVSKQADNSTTE